MKKIALQQCKCFWSMENQQLRNFHTKYRGWGGKPFPCW